MQVFGDADARVGVRVDGAGADAVVFIHGFSLASEMWNAQSTALARDRRTIAIDLRGMGSSSVPDGPYLMETLASDVAGVLDALGVERAMLVGHSLGGYVALAFARMFSERVTALALVSSRLAADTAEQAAARYELADRVEAEASIGAVVDAFVPRLLAPEIAAQRPDLVESVRAMMARTDPRGAAAMLRGMALRDAASDIAPDLTVPVVAIAGRYDLIIPLEEARAVAAAFPHGRLVVCEQSGHMPMLEEPDLVTETLASLR
jgi:3-oxoadipate enol-lactonase